MTCLSIYTKFQSSKKQTIRDFSFNQISILITRFSIVFEVVAAWIITENLVIEIEIC